MLYYAPGLFAACSALSCRTFFCIVINNKTICLFTGLHLLFTPHFPSFLLSLSLSLLLFKRLRLSHSIARALFAVRNCCDCNFKGGWAAEGEERGGRSLPVLSLHLLWAAPTELLIFIFLLAVSISHEMICTNCCWKFHYYCPARA